MCVCVCVCGPSAPSDSSLLMNTSCCSGVSPLIIDLTRSVVPGEITARAAVRGEVGDSDMASDASAGVAAAGGVAAPAVPPTGTPGSVARGGLPRVPIADAPPDARAATDELRGGERREPPCRRFVAVTLAAAAAAAALVVIVPGGFCWS